MGLLSRQAIAKRLGQGDLVIEPPPRDEDYDSDAVDVHLEGQIYEWENAPTGATYSLSLWRSGEGQFVYNEFSRRHLKPVPPDNAGVVTLRPHSFYLADLLQHTTLPPDLAMHIQGRSSLARLGVLVHLTAPHAHAGWSGRLALEIYNLGPFNIEMKRGMPIGQLTFWTVEDPEFGKFVAGGQFARQKNARGDGGE